MIENQTVRNALAIVALVLMTVPVLYTASLTAGSDDPLELSEREFNHSKDVTVKYMEAQDNHNQSRIDALKEWNYTEYQEGKYPFDDERFRHQTKFISLLKYSPAVVSLVAGVSISIVLRRTSELNPSS